MRILFDQSSHDIRNKGNNALLENAMQKLSAFWPDAFLEVITSAPNLLTLHYPRTIPINPISLCRVHSRFDQYKRFLPGSIWWLLFEAREELWHRRYARTARQEESLEVPSSPTPSTEKKPEVSTELQATEKIDLQKTISQFDLFVASGGGYMTDTDKPMLWNVFDRLEAAIRNGIPTIMVGQGIGPLKDPQLLARAREILPCVLLILYRNQRNGLPLLESLGVSPERILLTGDDAIEMAYKARSGSLGQGIGVSLRVAHYTQMESEHINIIRKVLHQSATRHQAELIAVPISSARHESDVTHIREILKGYGKVSVGWRKLGTPMDAVRLAGKCRVMVTGTYHGAIFSLAQGIPVVGIAKSTEYFDKLSELSDEFPEGVNVIHLSENQMESKLSRAIEEAWGSAPETMPTLLKDAARLIDLQHRAYKQIYEVVNRRIKC